MPTIPTGQMEKELRKLYLRWLAGMSVDSDPTEAINRFARQSQDLIEKMGGRTAALGALAGFPVPKRLDLSPTAGVVYDNMRQVAIQANMLIGANSVDAARAMFRNGMDKSFNRLKRLARTETTNAYWKNAFDSISDLPALVMVWGAERGPRTCPWCLERDGLVMDSPNLRDHPNGRCTPIPMLRSEVKYRGSIDSGGRIYMDDRWGKATPSAVSAPVETFEEIFEADDEDVILAKLAQKYEGRDYNGFQVQMEEFGYGEEGPGVRMNIVKGDEVAGYINRVFMGDTVYHDTMELSPKFRGQGFSSAFSAHSEDLYRQSGITRITLQAGLDDGGYVWAKAGYQLDPEFYAAHPKELLGDLRQLQGKLDAIGMDYIDDEEVAGVLAAFSSNIDEVLEEGVDLLDILDLAELANLFDARGVALGRRILAGTSWRGVKEL